MTVGIFLTPLSLTCPCWHEPGRGEQRGVPELKTRGGMVLTESSYCFCTSAAGELSLALCLFGPGVLLANSLCEFGALTTDCFLCTLIHSRIARGEFREKEAAQSFCRGHSHLAGGIVFQRRQQYVDKGILLLPCVSIARQLLIRSINSSS